MHDKKKIVDALNILAVWYRDILVLKSAETDKFIINRDRINDLNSETAKFSQEALLDILEEVKNASFFIEQNVNPKLTLSSLASRIGV